jgi:endonuclease/exonuclease/phosphatase (EEP) superfamily protein YafD
MALAAAPLAMLVIPPWWHFGSAAAAAQGRPRLRVMSANLLVSNQQPDAIIAEILAADPDVLLVQEYPQHWHDALSKALRSRYPYSTWVIQDDSFGMATYSRIPFIDPVNNFLPLGVSRVPQSRMVVTLGGREIALYNVHLLPPRSLSYVTEHRRQFADLRALLSSESLPYVLTGDFNFTPTAPQAHHLSRIGARDSHDLAGTGRAATWPVQGVLRYVPGIHLDHVYVSSQLEVIQHEIGTGSGSDHRPVIVEIVLP